MKKPISTLLTPALILRLGGAICFIGHGLLALNGKEGFVNLLGTFDLQAAQALNVLKVIGSIDILVGLLILFKPYRAVLHWAMLWTGLTILAWGIHGDSLMDLARRAPYFTTPMALLYLLYRRGAGSASQDKGALADDEILASGNSTGQAAIESLDLSMISMKLQDPHEGEGWSEQQCAEVAQEYRRFLTLKLIYPNEPIVPNLAIDTMWHFHILDTQAYYRDCQAIFGDILHHYPYFGMKGESDQRQFFNAFDRTKILYAQVFGMSMDSPTYLPSFRNRRSA